MKLSNTIRSIKDKKQWAVFCPKGELLFHSVSNTEKEAKRKSVEVNKCWNDLAIEGFTTKEILINIKLL